MNVKVRMRMQFHIDLHICTGGLLKKVQLFFKWSGVINFFMYRINKEKDLILFHLSIDFFHFFSHKDSHTIS